MTNPLDEQQAAHVRCLQDFAAAYDAESENGRALRAAIDALTAPPLCAKGEVATVGRMALGSVEGYLMNQRAVEVRLDAEVPAWITDEPFVRVTLAPEGTTPAQPRREVTDDPRVAELIEAVEAFKDLPDVEFTAASTDEAACDRLDAALESFANGGDGNG